MQDATVQNYEGISVHSALWAFGVGLVDNVSLEGLSEVCADANRYEFLFTVTPLRVLGGTGSPVNPIAIL